MNPLTFANDFFEYQGMELCLKDPELIVFLDELFEKDMIVNIVDYLNQKKIINFCILKNLYVNEKFRGQNLGNRALNEFIDLSNNLPIFLVCDNLQLQKGSIILEDWYGSKGFVRTPFICRSGPLMVRF